MDILRLYTDFSIELCPEEHKHHREGWVNTSCPFCESEPGHEGFHLGWNLAEEYFYCWRCGWHPPILTVSKLLKVPNWEAAKLLNQYKINRTIYTVVEKPKRPFQTPSDLTELNSGHTRFLKKRGFNPYKLVKDWKIAGTGPLSFLHDGERKIDYRFRIYIPYFWNNELVSFDTRDYTEKQSDKYKACPKHLERMERKHILYGMQEAWTSTGICVEGPTDVWRMGKNSFAVSGIQYTQEQVRLIAKIFKRVWIVFDSESQAQKQAKNLEADLRFRGVKADRFVLLKGDPGGLPQYEADKMVENLMKH
jgi:hypothetical protein